MTRDRTAEEVSAAVHLRTSLQLVRKVFKRHLRGDFSANRCEKLVREILRDHEPIPPMGSSVKQLKTSKPAPKVLPPASLIERIKLVLGDQTATISGVVSMLEERDWMPLTNRGFSMISDNLSRNSNGLGLDCFERVRKGTYRVNRPRRPIVLKARK